MQPSLHLSREQLETQWNAAAKSPLNHGRVEMIVRRPRKNEREELAECLLDSSEGLEGDCWSLRNQHVDTQLTLMNSRLAMLVAGTRERWALAGDQLYVDLDLSEANLPPGTRLALGEVILEVTAEPHTGCRKFSERFGSAALQFVNSPQGKQQHLRGIYARVIQPGKLRCGDTILVKR